MTGWHWVINWIVFGRNDFASNLRKNPEFVCRGIESSVIDILAESMSTYLWRFTAVHQTWNIMHVFKALSHNCEKVTALSFPSVCPSVRIEQLGSQCTDFHEFWYMSIFRKSFERIQDSIKYDKNNGHFTWRPMYIYEVICSFLSNSPASEFYLPTFRNSLSVPSS